MGWTGRYLDGCPKGQERIDAAVRQEGYNYTDASRRSEIIDSAIRNGTVYLAVRYTDTENDIEEVYGVVILTHYNKGLFTTKSMSENMGPVYYDCPVHILERLSPTENEHAKTWRDMCRKVREKKNKDAHDPLSTMESGQIRVKGHDGIWSARRYHKRRVFVNYSEGKYLTLSYIRRCGYEIVAE